MIDLDLKLVAHELLCLGLFYSSFCRAVKSDTRVHVDVRLAFNCLGAVACWGLVVPLLDFVPNNYTLALLAAVVYTQWVTASHWAEGVPDKFVKPEHRPTMRRASDRVGQRRG